jgi:urea transport system permease protein
MRSLLVRIFACLLIPFGSAHALDADTLKKLATGENSDKVEILGKLVEQGDATAIPVLQALRDGTLSASPSGVVAIVDDKGTRDPLTGKALSPVPADLDKVTINNRVRRELGSALAGLRLSAPQVDVRLAAASELQRSADEDMAPLLAAALAKEQDAGVKAMLILAKAGIDLKSSDTAVRLGAVKALGDSNQATVVTLLQGLLERKADNTYAEPDEAVRAAAAASVKSIEGRLSRLEVLGNAFSGLSLGSVLLLAALGLAITFGLMGIINMAHGELLMIGAYATYSVQLVFKHHFAGAFDWYLVAAVPVAFLASAVVGMALERGVLRFLYGRPLETLLATWGISLILIQVVRSIYGAQNVEVANPSWMSGGIALASGLVFPYNRIVIICFAAFVVFMVWLMLNQTRLGLFVRAVTQNRTMADCVGVPTSRIDTLTFGLGCGIAGLGGCALSQIGNVGPELGQGYIVDSFMVVVLGGVGQLAGTIIAALGLGWVNKFLEPWAGAVMAKIFILVFIVVFIQKRPQGLFAMRGRSAEANA